MGSRRIRHNCAINTTIINYRIDRCLCMTESLRRSPTTTTTLFVNWSYSNIKLKVKKKKKDP